MSIQEKFKEIIEKHKFDVLNYIFLCPKDELSQFQKENIENAILILEGNLGTRPVQYFGGNLKKNEEELDEYIETIKKEIEKSPQDIQKDLGDTLKKYNKILKEYINKSCYAIIPVREMPWADILFRTIPTLIFKEKTIELKDNIISYYGEINCLVSKSTIYGRIKDEQPLFAPIMGEFDINYKFSQSDQKAKKSFKYNYISAIIKSLESTSTKNHLTRYHEGYQRRGDPISDFLNKKEELFKKFSKLTSSMESGRINTKISILGVALPQPSDNTTLVLVLDEGEDTSRFEKCFEVALRFSAACCEAPKPPINQTLPDGGLRTPGGQELKVWSTEELAKQASQRNTSSIPNGMEVWTEEDLSKVSKERQSNLPEGMEVWSEEELQELSKKRQGNLDIPSWEPDRNMNECSNCNYSLREGWDECPICGTPIDDDNKKDE
ncbi:MAG: hypothetical protein KGD63_08860 [Candidatus Lokiarchaeota archaeon]|nr:hypothetical protein [Candidatus Lokiarchaeota archaeon]